MSKKYDDVKRAAEAALKGLIKAINENLEDEEADNLKIELSMSLFTASLDFSLPINEFISKLAALQAGYTLEMSDTVINIKKQIDLGNDYDTEEI